MDVDDGTGTIIHRVLSPTTHLSYLTNLVIDPHLCLTRTHAPITQLALMIHGWGCQAIHYAPLITYLTAQDASFDQGSLYVAVDLPGHGQSPGSALPEPDKGGVVELVLRLGDEVLGLLGLRYDQVQVMVYGHSMGTRTALEVCAILTDRISRLVLLDGSWAGDATPEDLDLGEVSERAAMYRGAVQERLHLYFGPRTSTEFERETREGFGSLDYEYALRMGYWYNLFDAGAAEVLDDLNSRNRDLVAAGRDPTHVLVVQSQESQSPGGRHSIKKGETTEYMRFLRTHIAREWLQEWVVEEASHYPHVDDIGEVGPVIHAFTRN
ncbi:alpha/beta-hydrolase [Aspergillus heteromorphus CBS 117.55]|uniref:Alpha/beta-hydrolase n=1 Tax=Aspergillus heteromorphus CBS 117.55 TaxID=1448321 RepID=A0A317WFL2_9EURO|nr:alpha/beta-hydrolase [Aspergillus heteromorphus CBS 117.55]PWY85079.1 alpha/beta-hydrolase [Aspergillus heteromorphus CBS 117.55]